MNWDDLRYFLVLAREGSVSAAGKALGVKHTTVSRRISGLEADLGVRLFDRSREGYVMTQAAENMYKHAVEMESLATTVDREVFGRDAELAGRLVLTASHNVTDSLLLPRIKAFTDTYPNINLEILTVTGLLDLSARQADIAVRLTPKPPDYLVGREVMKMRHGIYGTQKTLENLSENVNVILFRDEEDYPPWVTDHFSSPKTALRIGDDVTSMAAVVRNHIGIARLPCFIGDSDPELRRMDIELPPSDWGIWILSHVDLRATARVRVCREFLIEVLEQQRGLIQGENSRYMS